MAKTIKLPELQKFHLAAMVLPIVYGFGEKFAPISDPTPDELDVDCSGYVRWLVYHGSDEKITMPDGSWNQEEWCEKKGFQKVAYRTALADRSGAVYMCFLPSIGGKARHVWMLQNSKTLESHFGVGPNTRAGRTPVLFNNCHKCYKLT